MFRYFNTLILSHWCLSVVQVSAAAFLPVVHSMMTPAVGQLYASVDDFVLSGGDPSTIIAPLQDNAGLINLMG